MEFEVIEESMLGNSMMRTVIERLGSRLTRSLAISKVENIWPTPGEGMMTSSAASDFCIFVWFVCLRFRDDWDNICL